MKKLFAIAALALALGAAVPQQSYADGVYNTKTGITTRWRTVGNGDIVMIETKLGADGHLYNRYTTYHGDGTRSKSGWVRGS